MTASKYRAALYMRLSRDDEGAAESASITAQRGMLRKFAEENRYQIYDEYIDDGFSGTNFRRPAFERMLRDIESGRVNMVITKDLSRLGRDYITTGEYTEIYFPARKVRCIAVNDGYDSDAPCTDIAPFKNVINEMYARDISKKIRSALAVKMQEGAFVGSRAPYGYRRDPADKHHLVIDETAGSVVKEIFRSAAAGVLPVNIARSLNNRRILPPSLYRCENSCGNFCENSSGNPRENFCALPALTEDGFAESRGWTSGTIAKMLRNIVYLGHMAQGKTTKVSFKSGLTVENPKQDWYIVKNTHEALVDEETFRLASKKSKQRTCGKKGTFRNIFSGIAVCADCGRSMSAVGTRKKGSAANLACGAYKQYGSSRCTNHFIDYDVLYEIVLSSVRKAMQLSTDTEKAIIGKAAAGLNKNSRLPEGKAAAPLKKRKVQLDRLIENLYEDRAKQLISTERMHRMLRKYESESSTIEMNLHRLAEETARGKKYPDSSRLRKRLTHYTEVKELTPELLHRLIDRIEIGQGVYTKTEDGQMKEQTVKIVYRCGGAAYTETHTF